MLCLKIAGWVANSVDPDETPQNAHLSQHCLLRPVCLNTYGDYVPYLPENLTSIWLPDKSMKKNSVDASMQNSVDPDQGNIKLA